jgi:hypothetical protein
MWLKIKKVLQTIYTYFNTTTSGLALKRAAKTFIYTFLAVYIATRTTPFHADFPLMLESALLAAAGFGADKGIREYIKQ